MKLNGKEIECENCNQPLGFLGDGDDCAFYNLKPINFQRIRGSQARIGPTTMNSLPTKILDTELPCKKKTIKKNVIKKKTIKKKAIKTSTKNREVSSTIPMENPAIENTVMKENNIPIAAVSPTPLESSTKSSAIQDYVINFNPEEDNPPTPMDIPPTPGNDLFSSEDGSFLTETPALVDQM